MLSKLVEKNKKGVEGRVNPKLNFEQNVRISKTGKTERSIKKGATSRS